MSVIIHLYLLNLFTIIFFLLKSMCLIVVELLRPEVARFGEIWRNFVRFFGKATFTGTFSKFCSERIHRDTDRRAMFKFRDIGPTGNR